MDRNEIYEEIDLSEDRINSVMKAAGYLNIVYGIAIALISIVGWGAMALGFLQVIS